MNKDKLYKTMFLQATLCHDSQNRTDIVQKNVLDSQTFQELIIDLRMAYYFEACKLKKQQWANLIGDVTYEQAYNSDETAYDLMIGTHTHGHSKKQFWALLRAATINANKLDIFYRKSNGTVKNCLKRIK